MNIELRLKSLEARKSFDNGVFLILPNDDGTVFFTTKKGKKKLFPCVEDAAAAIYSKHANPVIIVLDVL